MSIEKKRSFTFKWTEKDVQSLYDLIDFGDKDGEFFGNSMENYLKKLLLNNSSPPPSDSLVTTVTPDGAKETAPLPFSLNIGNASKNIVSGFSEKQNQKLRFEIEKARIKTQARIDAEKGVQVVKERVKRYHQREVRGTFEDGSGNGGLFSDIIGWV